MGDSRFFRKMGLNIFGGDLAPKASPDYCAWRPTRLIFLGNQEISVGKQSCLELCYGHFELTWRFVIRKRMISKKFRFSGHFWGKKSRFLPFFNFSRQPGKSEAKDSCVEFYCGHFELSWRSLA